MVDRPFDLLPPAALVRAKRAGLLVEYPHASGSHVWRWDLETLSHDQLLTIVPRLPEDYDGMGGTVVRWRDPALPYPDCSCGCVHAHWLAGNLGADWCVCGNEESHRFGLLTFEHQGCQKFVPEPEEGDRPPPKRIQRRRVKGWRLPPNAVSVTRPGKWGNPFPMVPGIDPVRARTQYVTYLNEAIAAGKLDPRELRGKDLACFCKLDAPWCHAEELLRLANAEEGRVDVHSWAKVIEVDGVKNTATIEGPFGLVTFGDLELAQLRLLARHLYKRVEVTLHMPEGSDAD